LADLGFRLGVGRIAEAFVHIANGHLSGGNAKIQSSRQEAGFEPGRPMMKFLG